MGDKIAAKLGLFLCNERIVDNVGDLRVQRLRGYGNVAAVLRRESPLCPEGSVRAGGGGGGGGGEPPPELELPQPASVRTAKSRVTLKANRVVSTRTEDIGLNSQTESMHGCGTAVNDKIVYRSEGFIGSKGPCRNTIRHVGCVVYFSRPK